MQVLIAPRPPAGAARGAPATEGGEVEPYDFYRPYDPRAPLLRLNMVSSVDGRVTDPQGRSGGLGDEADLAAFRAMRALADAILVGAGTARTEGYGPHRIHASVAERRREDGRDKPAAVVVVSASLDLDPSWDLFRRARTPTIVLTGARAPRDRVDALSRVADVMVTGDDDVDLVEALAQLRARGLAHVLCEGGPLLNAALLTADLVDELCLTLAPFLLPGDGPRLVAPGAFENGGLGNGGVCTRGLGDGSTPGAAVGLPLRLLGLARAGDELFARYGLRTERSP